LNSITNILPIAAANDEPHWILQAQAGDQHAFHQLYLLYHKKIYALCWRLLADKDSAEDVCQDVFIQLWQCIDKFRGDSKFSTWLHALASNCVFSHLRKQKSWLQRILHSEPSGVELIDSQHSITEDEIHSSGETLEQLDQHIAKLPERARLVFVLFAIEGYRHEEISQKLDMAVGTSKAQYHRAKTLLKEWLA
jgi:RNA polymerase sigma factor (sigma-70 family)